MKNAKHVTPSRWRLSTEDLSSQQLADRVQQDLPEELGRGQTDIFKIDQGLNFINTRLNPVKNLAIDSNIEQHDPRLGLRI